MKQQLFLILVIPVLLVAREKQSANNLWQPFEYFVGKWAGHETGKAGTGQGTREYSFIMNGTYLYQENTSHFEPQEKNPTGETHEDRAFFSYDQEIKNFALREFHSEGFINYYTLDTTSCAPQKFVFVSQRSENAPPNLKARLTLEIKNENEFIETFELAFNGKDFSEFLKNYWTREE